MAASANLAATPRNGVGQVSAANTNRDGTGTIVTIFTAGTNGSRIDSIEIKAPVSTTTGMVRLYINDGTNTRLLKEVPVSAITVSASVAGFAAVIDRALMPLILPASYSLRASTHNAEALNIFAMGGDF